MLIDSINKNEVARFRMSPDNYLRVPAISGQATLGMPPTIPMTAFSNPRLSLFYCLIERLVIFEIVRLTQFPRPRILCFNRLPPRLSHALLVVDRSTSANKTCNTNPYTRS